MNLIDKLKAAFDGVASYFHQFTASFEGNEGFIRFIADMALYTFLLTSIFLFIVMLIAKPRNFLDVTLTFRQFVLSAVLSIGLVTRWRGDQTPLWFLTIELLVLSIAGILVIVALFRDYFWFYWNERRSD